MLFAWERHWARMMRDARLLSVTMPADADKIERSLLRLIAEERTAELHAAPGRGAQRREHVGRPAAGGRVSDVIALTADSKDWGESVRLTVQPNGRFAAGEFSAAKILSWGANLVWAERAQRAGF